MPIKTKYTQRFINVERRRHEAKRNAVKAQQAHNRAVHRAMLERIAGSRADPGRTEDADNAPTVDNQTGPGGENKASTRDRDATSRKRPKRSAKQTSLLPNATG